MSTTVNVTTQGLGEVEVRKLALGDYSKLLKSLKRLPAEIGELIKGKSKEDFQDIGLQQIIEWLPSLMETAPEEIIHIIVLSTDLDDEKVRTEMDLADAAEVFDAILDINDYRRVIDTVKKMVARRKGQKEVPAETTQ